MRQEAKELHLIIASDIGAKPEIAKWFGRLSQPDIITDAVFLDELTRTGKSFAKLLYYTIGIHRLRLALEDPDTSAKDAAKCFEMLGRACNEMEAGGQIKVNLNQQNNTVDFETAMEAVRRKNDKKAITVSE